MAPNLKRTSKVFFRYRTTSAGKMCDFWAYAAASTAGPSPVPVYPPGACSYSSKISPFHFLRAGSVKDAVRSKDLSRALRFLQSVEPASSTGAAAAAQVALPVPPGRDWEVLDACIDADDMMLVGRTDQFLSDGGILANFGKCKNIVLEGPREVTPTVLKEMAVLEAAKLAPKKWSISGNSPYVLVAFLGVYLIY